MKEIVNIDLKVSVSVSVIVSAGTSVTLTACVSVGTNDGVVERVCLSESVYLVNFLRVHMGVSVRRSVAVIMAMHTGFSIVLTANRSVRVEMSGGVRDNVSAVLSVGV